MFEGIAVQLMRGEPIDAALRRFKKACERASLSAHMRRHEHFVKPSTRRRSKANAARKRRNEGRG